MHSEIDVDFHISRNEIDGWFQIYHNEIGRTLHNSDDEIERAVDKYKNEKSEFQNITEALYGKFRRRDGAVGKCK